MIGNKALTGVLRRTEIAQARVRLGKQGVPTAPPSAVDLPMPASPESNTTCPSPGLCLRPAAQQDFKFFFSPDKFAQAARMESIEAALD